MFCARHSQVALAEDLFNVRELQSEDKSSQNACGKTL